MRADALQVRRDRADEDDRLVAIWTDRDGVEVGRPPDRVAVGVDRPAPGRLVGRQRAPRRAVADRLVVHETRQHGGGVRDLGIGEPPAPTDPVEEGAHLLQRPVERDQARGLLDEREDALDEADGLKGRRVAGRGIAIQQHHPVQGQPLLGDGQTELVRPDAGLVRVGPPEG